MVLVEILAVDYTLVYVLRHTQVPIVTFHFVQRILVSMVALV